MISFVTSYERIQERAHAISLPENRRALACPISHSLTMHKKIGGIDFSILFIKGSFHFLHRSSFVSYEKIEEFFHLLLRDRRTHVEVPYSRTLNTLPACRASVHSASAVATFPHRHW